MAVDIVRQTDGWPNRPTMTLEEAAHLLGISRRLAYTAAKAGEIPTLRFGRRIVVPTARLRELIEGGAPKAKGA